MIRRVFCQSSRGDQHNNNTDCQTKHHTFTILKGLKTGDPHWVKETKAF